MLEAYEIGISLALQDGVSDGIALIRRDLAALDRAIAATSQNLKHLQTQAGVPSPVHVPTAIQPRPVAQAASSPSTPEQQTTPAAAKTPLQLSMTAPPRSDAPLLEGRSQISTRATPAGAPTFQNTPQSPKPAISVISTSSLQSPPAATLPRQASFDPPSISAVPQALPVSPHDGSRPAPPFAPAAPSPLSTVQIAAKVAAAPPIAPTQRPSGAAIPLVAAPPSRAAPAPVATPQPPAAAAQLTLAAPLLQQSLPRPASRHTEHRQHPAPNYAQAPRRHEQPGEPTLPPRANRPSHAAHQAAESTTQPTMAARPAAPPGQSVLLQTSAPQPARTGSFAPPPPSSEQTITLQGDIILDGARLGRWMTSSLARQAARPPTGPTGPDPRQTPLWSGQAQGF
jgi:hypothetical protein